MSRITVRNLACAAGISVVLMTVTVHASDAVMPQDTATKVTETLTRAPSGKVIRKVLVTEEVIAQTRKVTEIRIPTQAGADRITQRTTELTDVHGTALTTVEQRDPETGDLITVSTSHTIVHPDGTRVSTDSRRNGDGVLTPRRRETSTRIDRRSVTTEEGAGADGALKLKSERESYTDEDGAYVVIVRTADKHGSIIREQRTISTSMPDGSRASIVETRDIGGSWKVSTESTTTTSHPAAGKASSIGSTNRR